MKKTILLLLFPILVNADPGPVTQYLVSQQATLLDIGMMRLENLTTAFENRVGLHWTEDGKAKFFTAEINSRYEPNDDKIYVSFLIMNSEPTEAQMSEACENATGQMNIWLRKSLPGLFLHAGYDNTAKPSDLHAGISEMFELRCYFSSGRDTSEGRFWASRTLGGEMKIGRWAINN